MKILGKIVKTGNAMHVTIPARLLRHLGWRGGDRIIVELTPANTIEVRKPTLVDLQTNGLPMVLDDSLPGAPR